MAIKYFPNRIFKKNKPAIDRVIAKRNPKEVRGSQNILADSLNAIISAEDDWQIDSIAFEFNNATARNYSAKVKNGRKVLSDLNDYLWFRINGTLAQQITLDSGFYTGTELAAELKSKLDANSAFSNKGITFNVVYDNTTGIYAITPSSGQIEYFNVNTAKTLRTRDSLAGHLFGFNQDTGLQGSISSDTSVPSLDSEMAIINETGSTSLSHYHDDVHTFSIDQALSLESNNGVDVTINYVVVYEEIV